MLCLHHRIISLILSSVWHQLIQPIITSRGPRKKCSGFRNDSGEIGSQLPSKLSLHLPAPWIIFPLFQKLIFNVPKINYFCNLPSPSRIYWLLPNYFPPDLLLLDYYAYEIGTFEITGPPNRALYQLLQLLQLPRAASTVEAGTGKTCKSSRSLLGLLLQCHRQCIIGCKFWVTKPHARTLKHEHLLLFSAQLAPWSQAFLLFTLVPWYHEKQRSSQRKCR